MFRIFLTVLLLCMLSHSGLAAPDDRGQRGTYLSLSGALAMGTAIDDRGQNAGSHLGHSYHLRVGEEVFDRLTLGMMLTGGTARANQDLYDLFFGGLLVDLSWQFMSDVPLSVLIATGLGGARMDSVGDEGFTGTVAGAIHVIGLQYDFHWHQPSGAQWTLSPYLRAQFLPASGDALAQVTIWSFGAETTWSWGR